MAIEAGQRAPEFTLKSSAGDPVSLADFRGERNVVLVFFPEAFSSVCTDQWSSIGANEARYAGEDAQVIGISVDNQAPLRAFAERLGLTDTLLLSDFEPKGATAQAYGVYIGAPWGLAGRATFVIDRDGVVRYRALTDTPLETPDEAGYLEALSACNSGGGAAAS